MSLQHFGKGALRVAKNYTKGYSDVQAKVREATSNDPWGPSGTQMNEIAQMTYNQQDFVEIMEMIDKRLNDKGKNWRHVFKALTVLDYCLHAGSENVVLYFKDNLYVIKTLKEFQYIDEDMKDQGANVRQKAKDISNLLTDETRLREQRRSRAHMRDRMVNGQPLGEYDEEENENVRRRNAAAPSGPSRKEQRARKEEDDLKKALELSRQSLEDEKARHGRLTAEERDLQEALKLSKEEEAKRLKGVEDANSRALFDDGNQLAAPSTNPFPLIDTSLTGQPGLNPQFTANPYWAQQQQQLAQQQAQQQAEYEWMLRQQQQREQQAQLEAIQQQQQESWMRQQLLLQQQQEQQQLLYQQQMVAQQQQSLFAPPVQAHPTGYGSNNPFALATGTSNFSSPAPPAPSFDFSTSISPQPPQQPVPQPQPSLQVQRPTTTPSPQPPSPTTANTLANARRANAITSDKHAHLNDLFANRDDGQDTFGNIGILRYGHTGGAAHLMNQSTGTNPFAKTNGQQQQGSEQPFFQI